MAAQFEARKQVYVAIERQTLEKTSKIWQIPPLPPQ